MTLATTPHPTPVLPSDKGRITGWHVLAGVTAYIAAAVKAQVTLVEGHRMGGDCLNFGCVPSKALIRSAKFLSHVQRAKEFGMRGAQADFDFAEVMERVQKVIQAIEPHDSVERYTGLGVDVAQGTARIVSPWEVEITHRDGRVETLTTRAIVIASGARPFVPPIPGLADLGPTELLTSDNVWQLRQRPERLVVLGGGPIGSELTQTFARLGSRVTQVEMLPRILVREDPEVSELVTARFRAEGVTVLTGHKALRVQGGGLEKVSANQTGFEVAAAGAAVAFVVNAFSYIGMLATVLWWKPQRTRATLPPEPLLSASARLLERPVQAPGGPQDGGRFFKDVMKLLGRGGL